MRELIPSRNKQVPTENPTTTCLLSISFTPCRIALEWDWRDGNVQRDCRESTVFASPVTQELTLFDRYKTFGSIVVEQERNLLAVELTKAAERYAMIVEIPNDRCSARGCCELEYGRISVVESLIFGSVATR